MPNGLGRYGIEDAAAANANASKNFEWYLKNHLGSTMLVYGTQADANPAHSDIGTPLATYDYRAFGEMIELTPPPTDKVTENFTGKEHDDEIALDYFGARYLDPMLGMWISVDPARQFASPYLYAGNGMNPIIGSDSDGNWFNPFGCLVAVGVGLVESWNAQAEYRRISGENYSPLTEAIIGASVYLGYVAAGSFSYGANILESGIISGLWGGTLSGGAVAVVQGVGTGSLDGIDGNQVRDSFTKGAISSMVGTFVGAGATEMMGGTLSEIYGVPSGQEVVGGAIGGIAGFLFDKNATLVPPPDQRNSAE
jgi:RHS repeat-associated protein